MSVSTNIPPIIFMLFRRPVETQKVFDRIRQARPRQLFVVGDGARNPEEAQLVQATRRIVEQVDWECDVRTSYATENMGLSERFRTGLSWAFSMVDQAVILEDDCVPDLTFFRFCQELLVRFRENERVMAIGGVNFHSHRYCPPTSYYFARYSRIWGWATWARAWQHYDPAMTAFSQDPDGWTRAHFSNPREARYYRDIWSRVLAGEINSWGYRWSYSLINRDGLSALPSHNLVTNIGWGELATHTSKISPLAYVPAQPMSFPMTHPTHIERDHRAEEHMRRSQGVGLSRYERLVQRVYRKLGTPQYGA